MKLFLYSRSLPPPNPRPKGGGTIHWHFQLFSKNYKLLYNILFCISNELEISTRRSPLPAGGGLGGGRDRGSKKHLKKKNA
ncbi:hypothetical protein BGP_1796 [Beggiatoa sp. PS]|nr:hypothetical protein BGP_1796 [Beggiatoa sp. PS]